MPNSYTADAEPFLLAMHDQDLVPMSIEQQVIDTFNGLSKSKFATQS